MRPGNGFSLQGSYSTAVLLVKAHVNEHGDGVVTVVGRKEVVGLLPLAMVRGPPTSQAMVCVQPMR